jgi:hypothetical protein
LSQSLSQLQIGEFKCSSELNEMGSGTRPSPESERRQQLSLKPLFLAKIFGLLALNLLSGSAVDAQLVERPLITARHAIVTSDEPLASMAGMRILQEGGNAFDAEWPWAYSIRACPPSVETGLRQST